MSYTKLIYFAIICDECRTSLKKYFMTKEAVDISADVYGWKKITGGGHLCPNCVQAATETRTVPNVT